MKLIKEIKKGKYTIKKYEVPSMHGPWYPSTYLKMMWWDGNWKCGGDMHIVSSYTQEDIDFYENT